MNFTKLARNTSLGPCLTILAQIRSSVNRGDLSTRSSSPGLVKISHLIKDKLAKTARNKKTRFNRVGNGTQKFDTLPLAEIDFLTVRVRYYSLECRIIL